MAIEYRFNCESTSAGELEQLFRAVNLGGRSGEKVRRAFVNSSVVCLAYDNGKLVGASRAITDGEYHGFVYDVAVLPDYQRRGIGRRMMQELMSRLPVWRVMLVADSGVQSFYRGLGFELYPDTMACLNAEHLYDRQNA